MPSPSSLQRKLAVSSAVILACILASGMVVVAEETETAEINDLQREIENKKTNIEHINRRIDEYKERIEEKHRQSSSLLGEVDLLENRIAKTDLDIKLAEEEMSAVNVEIRLIDKELVQIERKLAEDKEVLKRLLQKIQGCDNDMAIEVLFGTQTLSELFEGLYYLEDLNDDMATALKRAEESKGFLVDKRLSKDGKKTRLAELQKALERSKQLSDAERTAKESILAETQQSEAQFHALLYSLKQEQTYIDQQVALLQGEIEAKLSENDTEGSGPTVLSWPVNVGYKGISASFHDPTYPFRHLFEHSGIDIPQPHGTPIKAPAAGYVAWTRVGRMYGNYVMIIHTNGIATLYAHMSRIDVTPDQFVGRGEVIGLTGGTAGTPGAGLSTGPHLHFEVRKNGIPTNPLSYLLPTD